MSFAWSDTDLETKRRQPRCHKDACTCHKDDVHLRVVKLHVREALLGHHVLVSILQYTKKMVFSFTLLLHCIAPLTTEMFAPAMRYASENFEIVEYSVAIFLGISCALHIIHGILIDTVGKRPVCIYGLTMYIPDDAYDTSNIKRASFINETYTALADCGADLQVPAKLLLLFESD